VLNLRDRRGDLEKDGKGKVLTKPYLIKYNPPQDLGSLK